MGRPDKEAFDDMEITLDYMVIKAEKTAFDESCTWDIELHEMTSFDTFIAILERMEEAQEEAVYYLFIYLNKSIMNNIYRLFHDWTDIMTITSGEEVVSRLGERF